EREANGQDGPKKQCQEGWRMGVVNLTVDCEQRAAVEEKESEAEEEEDALEVALAAVAEDDDHPEKHEEGASGVADEADVEEGGHGLATFANGSFFSKAKRDSSGKIGPQNDDALVASVRDRTRRNQSPTRRSTG